MGIGGAEGQHQETARLLLRRLQLAAEAADGGGGPVGGVNSSAAYAVSKVFGFHYFTHDSVKILN